MEYTYKGSFLHDLPGHKAFQRSYNNSNPARIILDFFYIAFLVWASHYFYIPDVVWRFLLFAAVFVVLYLLTHPKKGDIQYKRMLQANGGEPFHQELYFTDTCIQAVNIKNGNHAEFAYDQFRYIIDAPKLLVFVMQHRACLILSKDSLEGGSTESLFAFMKEHCPTLKGKKPRRTVFGHWIHRIVMVLFAICTLWALLNLPGIQLSDRLSGVLTNSMSYQEMADRLAEVDIQISPDTIREQEEFDREYLFDTGEDYYHDAPRNQKIIDLLYWESAGVYDENDQWIASTSGVFWQDFEVWNTDSIYTDFLMGLSCMDEDLAFVNVFTQTDNGIVSITFDWQGQGYRLEAAASDDWFDTSLIYKIEKIIATDDERLYLSYDLNNGALFYYGTSQQVRELQKFTDLKFRSAVN